MLHGLKLFTPRIFPDNRGYFLETFRKDFGLPEFVQDNVSVSRKNVIRALHFQSSPGQAKLVHCLHGKIWDVVVDVRPESPTFGKWQAFELDSVSHTQLFIPIGFAHGFCVLSEEAIVQYKVSAVYNPATECSIRWNDPDIGISWPVKNPVLSARDEQSPSFKEVFREVVGHRK